VPSGRFRQRLGRDPLAVSLSHRPGPEPDKRRRDRSQLVRDLGGTQVRGHPSAEAKPCRWCEVLHSDTRAIARIISNQGRTDLQKSGYRILPDMFGTERPKL